MAVANDKGSGNKFSVQSVTQNIVDDLEKGGKESFDKVAKSFQKVMHEYDVENADYRKRIQEQLAEDAYNTGIKNEQELGEYIKVRNEQLILDKRKQEIETMKLLSTESKKEREAEAKSLERKKAILKLQEAVNKNPNDKDAKDQLKKAKRDDKVAERQEKARKDREEKGGSPMQQILEQMKEDAEFAKTEEGKQEQRDELQLKAIKAVGKAISEGLNAINTAISTYAKYQGQMAARLQGSSKSFNSIINSLDDIAFSPLLSAETLYSNVAELVGQGIVSNVEQRAMFATVKDNIAETFDVTADSLKRIIRIQQNDSTAARLGMEAYLTKWLNEYVENTEYLQSTFDNVASSLLEASAAMKFNSTSATADSTEFEWVVQKWLGALVGVGFSDSSATSIADALGKLGSGDVSVLSDSIGSLITLAAASAGLDIGDILTTGLTAEKTNQLMESIVEYLQEIAVNSDNNIIRNQLASMFGVSMSDLVSVTNLSQKELSSIAGDMLTYEGMYEELIDQFNDLPNRMSISQKLENLFSNFTFSTGMSIAKNPVTYALWQITDLIQGVTNGINIPTISALGTSIDLETTVENLMKLGIVGVSTLGNIGQIVAGVSSGFAGEILLNKLGVNANGAVIKQGSTLSGLKKNNKGITTSSNTYIGNTDSDTYYNSTINAAQDESQKKLDALVDETESEDPTVKYLNDNSSKLNTQLQSILNANNLQAYYLGCMVNSDQSTGSLISKNNQSIAGVTDSITEAATTQQTNDKSMLSVISTITNQIDVLTQAVNENASKLILSLSSISSSSSSTNGTSITTSSGQSISGNTNYSNYVNQNGTSTNVNTNTTSIVTNDSISNYLSEISFGDGFKSLVANVEKIVDKLDKQTTTISNNTSSITGFTNPTESNFTF